MNETMKDEQGAVKTLATPIRFDFKIKPMIKLAVKKRGYRSMAQWVNEAALEKLVREGDFIINNELV